MKRDMFYIDGGPRFKGYHDPDYRWNGWCDPYFDLVTVRAIAEWVNSDGELKIVISDSGQVAEIHHYDGEQYALDTLEIDGVTHYNFHGWVWDCDSDLEEVAQ